MTIYTFKLSKKKIAAVILAIAVVIAAIIILLPGGDGQASRTNGASSQTVSGKSVKTDADIADYIKALGYQVTPEPADVRMVTIPKTFDDVYTRYNEIQLENGFDLAKYGGKGVTLRTYCVTNYQGYDDVLLDILIYKNKVIGGAVYTASLDGFMHGLVTNPSK